MEMQQCLYLKEDDNINDLEIGDVIEIPMVVKGIEMREDMEMMNPEDEPKEKDKKEYKFYKLEYAIDEADDDKPEEEELKKAIKGAVEKTRADNNKLEPLPSKQTPYVAGGEK